MNSVKKAELGRQMTNNETVQLTQVEACWPRLQRAKIQNVIAHA